MSPSAGRTGAKRAASSRCTTLFSSSSRRNIAGEPSSTLCTWWRPSSACGPARSTFPRPSHIYRSGPGNPALTGARLASYSTGILGIGTVIGALLTPILAKRLDRRVVLGIFFTLMLIFLWLAFGYVFYMPGNAIMWFLVCTFFLGAGRRELRRLFVLASGTIRHRLPRERVCFHHQRRPFRRSGAHVPGGRDDPALWNARHSCGADLACIRGWTVAAALRRRDSREVASGMKPPQ